MGVFSKAMEFIFLPISLIPSYLIGPNKFPEPMFLVVLVLANVLSFIWPCEFSLTLHLIIYPFPDVFPSIIPDKTAHTFYFIIFEVSFIIGVICVFK